MAQTTSVLRGGIVLNEVLIDPNGTNNFDTDGSSAANDTDEFIEIYNLSTSVIDMSGLQLWDAGNGNWFTIPDGSLLGPGNYAVVIVGVQSGGALPSLADGNLAFDAGRGGAVINNGGDNVVLYDPTADEYVQLRYNNDAIDNPTSTYSGFSATAALIGAAEDWGSDVDGVSLVRDPAGDDTIVPHNTLSVNNASPGTAIDGSGGGNGGDPDITSIFDIQFTTNADGSSPLVGQTVTTAGTVTAVFEGGDRVFIQDGVGAWQGLFLFNPNGTVQVGDRIEVTGDVSEFFGLTQISNGAVTVVSSGNALPSAATLPTGDVSQEQWESVFVRVEDVTVTNANPDAPNDFGEFEVNDGSGPVRVDDLGSVTFNPVGGEALDFVQGPLNFSFSHFKIEPRNDDDLGIEIAPIITPIYDIQGAGFTSALDGQAVTTTGIVTALADNGFYIQDAQGDGDDATSDGIFVFTGSSPAVTSGDDVQVSGTVDEFFNMTEITDVTDIAVLGSGFSIVPLVIGLDGRTPPTSIIDDAGSDEFNPTRDGRDFYESLEGMLVTLQDAIAVDTLNNFGEFYAIANQGSGTTTPNDRGGITISEDTSSDNPIGADLNPERIQIDPNLQTGNSPEVQMGDMLGDVTGVVDFSFNDYSIRPLSPVTATPSGQLTVETSMLAAASDRLTVASYNVLNLDPNDNDGDADIANGQFARIGDHIANNLNAPDIIALQEVQDNTGSANDGTVDASETLQTLIEAIAAAGGPTYEFAQLNPANNTSGGQPGGNIQVAYLYNPERVDLVDGSLQSIGDGDPAFNDSRKSLAATFRFNGQDVNVIGNHFASKGGSDPLFGSTQPPANGSVEQREGQAQVVKAFVDNILAQDADANVITLGDFNEFQFFTPLEILQESLTNLTFSLPESDRYSFVFEGNSQQLDHILVSDRLVNRAEFDIVHINTGFSDAASDHDPVLSRFELDVPDGVIWGTTGSDRLIGRLRGETIFARAGNDTVLGFIGDDTIDGGDGDDDLSGGLGNDLINGGEGNDRLFGGLADDILVGGEGDDLLNGGLGDDTYTGGNGSDRFFISRVTGVETITDFMDGEDFIELSFGLRFRQLSIEQGTGDRVDDTFIRTDRGDRLLAVLENTDASTITAVDFV